jgi:hypothetical protein
VAEESCSPHWQTRARAEQKQEVARARYRTKGYSPNDLLPLTRPHLPQLQHLSMVYSDFEFISGLNHSLDQSPHDLIISGNALTDTPRGVLNSSSRHFLN